MRDRPDARGLIDAARAALSERLIPDLPEGQRQEALKVLRALDIARRELDAPADPDDDRAALVAAIRAGRHDGDSALFERLSIDVRARLALSDPDKLS